MKKGFTVIEILIAMVIMFSAIILVNMSIKAFNSFQKKSEIYQNFYTTALTLKDWISNEELDKKSYNGEMNGISYSLNIRKILDRKSYIYSMALGKGNYGDYQITLYQITMLLKKRNIERQYRFLLTKQLSLLPENEWGDEH